MVLRGACLNDIGSKTSRASDLPRDPHIGWWVRGRLGDTIAPTRKINKELPCMLVIGSLLLLVMMWVICYYCVSMKSRWFQWVHGLRQIASERTAKQSLSWQEGEPRKWCIALWQKCQVDIISGEKNVFSRFDCCFYSAIGLRPLRRWCDVTELVLPGKLL